MHGDLLRRSADKLKIVYTPLHGSGLAPVKELFWRAGASVSVVASQQEPDGAFPTVKAPNPEDPAAFVPGIALADETGANVILATDPDADRLGVAVRTGEGFKLLTGNQTGCVLLHYLLSSKKDALPKDALAVKSLVSTRMADAICERFSVKLDYVPTGFRYISKKIDECGCGGGSYIFGFEESYGYLAGGDSRDKDAVSSALLVAEACAYYAQQGKTLADVLQDMYDEYGFYLDAVRSYALFGKEGIEKIAGAMAALRAEPPESFGAERVIAADDLMRSSLVTAADGSKRDVGENGLNVLVYTLDNGAWVCARPSGTEPKLKLYTGVSASEGALAKERAEALAAALDARVKALLGV